jgi:predicted metal-dependent HD superfamily phosphohydrolase
MDFEAASDYALKRIIKEVSKNYHYHNVDHTIDVCKAVELLARAEKLSMGSFLLLKTAAMFHDLGMVEQYFLHEEASVEILCRVLPEFGYSSDEIKKISRLIYVTQFIERPKNKIEKIMCDADLDYLGRPDYFEISDRLRKEWEALDLRKFSDSSWIQYQIDFLQYHEYYTKSARLYRDIGKKHNIEKLIELL